MKQLHYILILSFTLTSCATVLNKSTTKINVYTNEPSTIIQNSDNHQSTNNKTQLIVPRSNDTIKLYVITDDQSKVVSISPKLSHAYLNNIFNYGIGFIFDRKTPKRFSYPARVFIDVSDPSNEFSKYGKANFNGELYLHFSLPHINAFQLTPENESTKSNTGFWGVSVGLDYYYNKNMFLSLYSSAVSDFFVPVPAAVDISGEYELMSSEFIGLSNNHKIKRISFGYGLSFCRNTWDFRYYNRFNPPPPTRDPVKKSHYALGLLFSSYFQAGERFNIGILYRPTFIRFNTTNQYQYEHLISIDFAWKFRLH